MSEDRATMVLSLCRQCEQGSKERRTYQAVGLRDHLVPHDVIASVL